MAVRDPTCIAQRADPMNIEQILSPERVAVDIELTSKKAVLEKLAEMLSSAAPGLRTQDVFDSLVARERLGTTGLGAGIAIPHGRVTNAGKPVGAFLRTEQPIDFEAVDNAPVDLFFALCVPAQASQEHLDLLAALAARFSNGEFVASLRRGTESEAVFRQLTAEGGNV